MLHSIAAHSLEWFTRRCRGGQRRRPYGITVSAGYQNQHQNCIRNNLEKTVRRTCITRTASYGPRSCAVSGPTCWNSLLPQLKSVSLTLQQFCDRLKTVLFSRSYARERCHSAVVTLSLGRADIIICKWFLQYL